MSFVDIEVGMTDEHRMFQEAIRKFCDEVVRPAEIALDKLVDPEEVHAHDSVLWDVVQQYRDLGYHTMFIPEKFGGMGVTDPLYYSILLEEMAWAGYGFALILPGMMLHVPFALASGDAEIIDRFVTKYLAEKDPRKVRPCIPIIEPNVGSDIVRSMDPSVDPNVGECVAKLEGDEYVINGPKSLWVSHASYASVGVVNVRVISPEGNGRGTCLVPLDDDTGVIRGKAVDKMGSRVDNQAELIFEDVRIPKKYMIYGPDTYAKAWTSQLTGLNCFFSTVCVGIGQAALEEAEKYARERIQSGGPLIEQQGIKLKLAEMFLLQEASRAIARRAVRYNFMNPAGSLSHAASAKVFCSEACFKLASEALQIHGSAGITKEYPIEKIFRDARTTTIADGASDTLKLCIAYEQYS